MNFDSIHNIDDVISALDAIIEKNKTENNTYGYFAALYRKVTIKVKEGIEQGFFDDNPRMEKLDVIFAKRYIDAYSAYQKDEAVTESWVVAFEQGDRYWPIVLQHLLVGMNAHINLDLGIAAAEVMQGQPIDDLEDDFNKINTILSDLVGEVEKELSEIWPTLKRILRWVKKVDDFLIDFSMEKARKGAWKFAKEYYKTPSNQQAHLLEKRDKKVAKNVHIIFPQNVMIRLLLGTIRVGERGTVKEKIEVLE